MADSDSASEGPRSNGEVTGSAATGASVTCAPACGRQRKRHRSGGAKHNVDTRGVSAGTGSVCKLFVRKAPCNFADPWRKHSQQSSTGTGFLLEGRWVVTNAHVVHRAVSVLVRPTTGNPVKYNARVVALGLPCDLAVLEVEENFWRGKESLKLSRELPKLDDNVTCIGFPVGGENISVTRGVVSRIDVNIDGLMRIQIDAAINPGWNAEPTAWRSDTAMVMRTAVLPAQATLKEACGCAAHARS
ncbi:unnamed protein product [Cladocopium goreaui]|uniref:Protease Do-like 9 n=1 Tax=Cladocopium goreaui TaxID=2562237 RepID=A0A9P1C5W6_9DINO|nr:unnamed protein product [Cladocopium goreaui]